MMNLLFLCSNLIMDRNIYLSHTKHKSISKCLFVYLGDQPSSYKKGYTTVTSRFCEAKHKLYETKIIKVLEHIFYDKG